MCTCVCMQVHKYMCVWGPKVDVGGLPWLLFPFTIQGLLLNAGASTAASVPPGSVSVPSAGIVGRLGFYVVDGNPNSNLHTHSTRFIYWAFSSLPVSWVYFLTLTIFHCMLLFLGFTGESHMRYYWQPFILLKQNFTWSLAYVTYQLERSFGEC